METPILFIQVVVLPIQDLLLLKNLHRFQFFFHPCWLGVFGMCQSVVLLLIQHDRVMFIESNDIILRNWFRALLVI